MKLQITILFLLILLPTLVQAQATETGFEQICSRELGLAKCIQQIYVFALGFGALLALLMLVLSGYRYMTAQGNAQQLTNAKEAFSSAFIGLIILFIAFILLYLINPDLVRFKNFQETLRLPEIKKPGSADTPDPDKVVTGGGGQPPVITLGGKNQDIREMDAAHLGVLANDPEGDRLTYNWVIESDPTGRAGFFKLEQGPTKVVGGAVHSGPRSRELLGTTTGKQDHNFAVFGVQSGSNEGKEIIVRVDVSDGVNTVSTSWKFTVKGQNRPPVPVIGGLLGTPQNRLMAHGSIAPDATKSTDPDGTSISTQRFLVSETGGNFKGIIVCTGCNGPTPGMSIPDMTAPIDLVIALELVDGLHIVIKEVTAYLAPKK